MCMTGTAVKDAVNIETSTEYQGILFAEVAIDSDDPYRSFKKLPAAIEYLGRVLGKTGYDSDKNRAYYRSDAKIAYARKG